MTAKLLLGLLLATTLTATAAQDRPQPTEDPCALARRIAQSPPCLAGSACEALDLWRENFGAPDVFPVRAGEQLGSMPVERAWKVLLGAGGLLAHFDGERVRVAESPSGPARPRRSSTRNCLVR